MCLDPWILRVTYGVRRAQLGRLLDIAELSDTRSSPVETSRYLKFSIAEFGF